MDKDKTIIERFTDVVKGVVDTASTAAMQAMEPDPKQVAGETNEQVYIPDATDAAATPAPLFAAPKKKRATASPKRANKRVAKAARAAKAPAKKAASKKTAKKSAAKKSAKIAAKTTKKTKKTAKKAVKKKKAKKSKR
jgi:predicted cobalt transporter CbtA